MSVVEIVVLLAISLVVVGAIFGLISGGVRHFGRTDNRVSGVSAAQLVLAQLRQDVRQMPARGPAPVVESDGSLRFQTADGASGAPREVCWAFDAKTSMATRDGAAVGAGRLAAVRFVTEGTMGEAASGETGPALIWVNLVAEPPRRPAPGDAPLELWVCLRPVAPPTVLDLPEWVSTREGGAQ